jgi:hypothetical protein
MVCTEVPNQIKFVSDPHPTGSRNDFIYTDFGDFTAEEGAPFMKCVIDRPHCGRQLIGNSFPLSHITGMQQQKRSDTPHKHLAFAM